MATWSKALKMRLTLVQCKNYCSRANPLLPNAFHLHRRISQLRIQQVYHLLDNAQPAVASP